MRACWPLVAFSLMLLPSLTAHADSVPQPLKLDSYRVKAALPAICSQIGGKTLYGTHARQCQLPSVTSKTPSSAGTAGRALPVTIRH